MDDNKRRPVRTGDGSYTLHSERYGQCFHSRSGAREEAVEKFIRPLFDYTGILTADEFTVLDVGFGLGYNCIELLRRCLQKKPGGVLQFISLEQDPAPAAESLPLRTDDTLSQTVIRSLLDNKRWSRDRISIRLVTGDARQSAAALSENSFDAVFLDGFSPASNPELWSRDFFQLLFRLLKEDGWIFTYSSAYPVVSGLEDAGFNTGMLPAVGRATGGVIAAKQSERPLPPFPERLHKERLATTGRLHYNDPDLNWSGQQILEEYQQQRNRLLTEGVLTIKQYRRRLKDQSTRP